MNQNLLPIITPDKIHHANRAHLCKFQKLPRVDVQVDNTKLKVSCSTSYQLHSGYFPKGFTINVITSLRLRTHKHRTSVLHNNSNMAVSAHA